MPIARKTVVDVDQVGVYHCISRCVRRAFLCGVDDYTGINYEHRRAWIADRLKTLSSIFGMEVFAYAVMSNHLHLVIRNRPDLASNWTAQEVAQRWCTLFPKRDGHGAAEAPSDEAISALVGDAERVTICRQRLGDISWFMRCLNEPIARRANREDKCTGRFWEGRFKCQRLMDEGAMLACMAYVDLNPVRARIADTLEDYEFTSVYDRMIAERASKRVKESRKLASPTQAQRALIGKEEDAAKRADWLLDFNGSESPFEGVDLGFYLSLVEWTGQNIREDKPGYVPLGLKPVLERFNLDTENWVRNVESYGGLFYRIAGPLELILARAREKGQSWLKGQSGSRQLYHGSKQAA
jgi:REP element-mobilizing transposase RayT